MSDAPELPPPRYEQVGNWKHLICDEQEWLARPASWGIDKLPDNQSVRKRRIFDLHFFGWLASFSTCAECRGHAQTLFTEDGLCVPPELSLQGLPLPQNRAAFQERYATAHSGGKCDLAQLLRVIGLYECGIVTYTELHNRCIDVLFELYDVKGREAKTYMYWQVWKDKDRELALELVGPNPFRPVAFDPAWRTDTAVAIARTMYESRNFGAMPILADALQDAGCESAEVLNHCRDPHAAHVRGCWVCDLVLDL